MTQTDSYEVLVVGAGPAGTAAATRAAELGARVGLIEARRTGGTCVNTGCVPTRVLAKTARFAREVRAAGGYGIDVGEAVVDWSRTVDDSSTSHGDDVRVGIQSLVSLERVGEESGPGEHVADGPVRLTWVDVDGGRQQREVDAVIMSTGWPASVEGLGLEAAGVRTEGPAIPVDAFFRTNVEHVFAAGDANQQAMLVQAALVEAEAAATNAVLGPTRRAPHRLLPSGGFTDPDYAGVGLTEAQARERDPHVTVATVRYERLERAVIDDREEGFFTLVADRRRDTLLGAHAGVEFAYPTYSAVIGEAARRLRAPGIST